MTSRGLAAVLAVVALGTLGCGSEGDEALGFSASPLVPGSNAAVVSNNVPLQMAPGEKMVVQVVMQNTGAASPANDWPFPSNYALHRAAGNNIWGWTSTKVTAATPVGSNHTFNVVITSPTTPGTYTFGAQMRLVGDLYFGQTLTVPNITVSAANTPQWDCELDPGGSDLPTNLAPNQTRTVTLKLNNTGSQAWAATNFYLRSQDTPSSFWGGGTSVPITQAVPAGGTTTVSFPITAPATPGTYSLRRQIADISAGGIGSFAGSCVDANITVGGAAELDATLASETFPVTMAAGDIATVSVVLNNTGSQTWTNDGNFVLNSQNSPLSLWGVTQTPVATPTAQGAQNTFTFSITAPTTPGTYNHRWRMRKLSGADAGYFGVLIDIPVTVDGGATPNFASSVVSQVVPTRMLAGTAGQFRITFQNTGNTAWSGSAFASASTSTPVSIWGVTSSALGGAETITTGQQREFVYNVTAPATPGTYDSRWRMRQTPGAGFFGAEAVSSVIVTLCGNGVLNAGEACDDGNWINGDDCSDVCAREGRVVDLASASADRTITGSQTNKQLASVAIGNVTGSGVASILVSENRNFIPMGQQGRNTAGAVVGFVGGAGFLNGSSTVVTSGFAFEILGATSNDSLGSFGSGGIQVGDVTGDGTPDVVAVAPGGDGPMEAKVDAGEVYVLTGGAGLTGSIDLNAVPAVQAAVIVGEVAGDALRLLALGDLTGDNVADVVVGSVAHAAGDGAVWVVAGGATLTGTIDLAAPGAATVYKIAGLGGATNLGAFGTVGNLGGTATLLIGAPNFAAGGMTNAGAAFAIYAPLTGAIDLSLAAGAAGGPDVIWLGQGASDKYGSAMAIGDVTGDGAGDAVIGATQARKAGAQVGTADVWTGPIASGTTYDLTSALPHARLLGRDTFDTNGSAIAVGDWTGDGVMEIAVTAPSGDGPANNRDGAGELLIVRGGATLTGSIDLSTSYTQLEVYGGIARDLLGSRPNTLAFGLIDADARADVCVGSGKGATAGALLAPGRVDCFRAGN